MKRLAKPAVFVALATALVVGPWLVINGQEDSGPAVPVAQAADRELAVTYLGADGTISRTSFVDSLTVYGDGKVSIEDISESAGFRNLSGFENPTFDGNRAVWTVQVDGQKELLTASDATGTELPVSVSPRYFLDGVEVPARRLASASGHVVIEYTLVNETARTQDLTFFGENGDEVTEPLTTYVPLLGQVQMDLPSSKWANLSVPGGRVITDDNGVHHVSFNPILTPLVGDVEQTVRIEGDVSDLELGITRIVVLPLTPVPGVDTAQLSADGATELYAGLGEIDANLVRLRDGTSELLAGMTKLQAGLVEAHAGASDAAAGAGQIAAGAADAHDGAGLIAAGAGDARAGADQIGAGVGAVGVEDTIVDGLSQILGGLQQLGDANQGLPAAEAGVIALQLGVNEILVGLGTTGTPDTILGGLEEVGTGIGSVNAGLTPIAAVLGAAAVDAADPPGAATTLRNDNEFLKDRATDAVAACDGYAAALTGLGVPTQSCTALGIGAATMASIAGSIDAKAAGARTGIQTQIQPGLTQLSLGVDELISGVEQVKLGLQSGSLSDPGVLEGLAAVQQGLAAAIAGIGTVGVDDTLTDGANRLLAGAKDVAAGLDELSAGLGELTGGAGDLTSGLGDLAAGAGELDSGLGDLDAGLGQLEAGAGDARAGTGEIRDGQTRLQAEGTSAARAGVATSANTASKSLAVLNAMGERGQADQFLYGPPSVPNTTGSAAYVYEFAEIARTNIASIAKAAAAALFVIGLALLGRQLRKEQPIAAI